MVRTIIQLGYFHERRAISLFIHRNMQHIVLLSHLLAAVKKVIYLITDIENGVMIL